MTILEWVLSGYCVVLMALSWAQGKLTDRVMDHARELSEVCERWRTRYLEVLTQYDPERAQRIGMEIAKVYAESALESCVPPRKQP